MDDIAERRKRIGQNHDKRTMDTSSEKWQHKIQVNVINCYLFSFDTLYNDMQYQLYVDSFFLAQPEVAKF